MILQFSLRSLRSDRTGGASHEEASDVSNKFVGTGVCLFRGSLDVPGVFDFVPGVRWFLFFRPEPSDVFRVD